MGSQWPYDWAVRYAVAGQPERWHSLERNAASTPVGRSSTEGRFQDRLNRYSNPAAFAQPLPDTFGTAPRYLGYRGPGVRTLNAALLKNWRVKEGQRIEFRLEADNATNTAIFNDPSGSFGASNSVRSRAPESGRETSSSASNTTPESKLTVQHA